MDAAAMLNTLAERATELLDEEGVSTCFFPNTTWHIRGQDL